MPSILFLHLNPTGTSATQHLTTVSVVSSFSRDPSSTSKMEMPQEHGATMVVTDKQVNSPTTPLEVIQRACGDKAYLLEKLPIEKVRFEVHNDDVSLGGGKATPVIHTKIHVANDLGGPAICIYAYLFENTESDPTTRVGYFGLNPDDEQVQYTDRDIVYCNSEFTDAFPTHCSIGMIPALVKYYFYALGVNLPSLPTFSKSNTADLLRACARFDTSTEVRNGSQVGEKSALSPRSTSSPDDTSPVPEGGSDTSRTMSPGPLIPLHYREEYWHKIFRPNDREMWVDEMTRASEQEIYYEKRLQEIAAAKKEMDVKAHRIECQLREIREEYNLALAHLANLSEQEHIETERLEFARAEKKRVLEEADPTLKQILELGIKIGYEEHELKHNNAGSEHGYD